MLYILGFFNENTDLEIATFVAVLIILIVGIYPLIKR